MSFCILYVFVSDQPEGSSCKQGAGGSQAGQLERVKPGVTWNTCPLSPGEETSGDTPMSQSATCHLHHVTVCHMSPRS